MSSNPNPSFSPSDILPSTFSHLLSLYSATARTVYETKLRKKSKKATSEDEIKSQIDEFVELDHWRYETLPAALGQRRADKEDSPAPRPNKRRKKDQDGSTVAPDNGLFLEEDELVRLMEWKLKHGTFRPALMNQIRTNPDFQIHSSTKCALSSLPAFFDSSNQDLDADANADFLFPGTAIDILHKALRGVGPATASLILSACTATNAVITTQVPFFSDEMYWWFCAQRYPVPSSSSSSSSSGSVSAKDVTQSKPAPKLKYTIKEYRELWDAVMQFVTRLDVTKTRTLSMQDVEKVAFVIGHFEMSGYEEGERSP